VVNPAASLPLIALDCGTPVIEINPEPTPLTGKVTYTLSGTAGRILPAILHHLNLRNSPISPL
jgi:NAD-dependent deacetylase